MKNYRVDGNKIKWNSVTSLVLESSEINAAKCKKCGYWVSHAGNGFIEGLNVGTIIGGDLLCDECLLYGSPLKF